VQQVADYQWRGGRVDLKKKDLDCDDVVSLAPGWFPVPLEEAALLVPLYAEAEQLGAVVLGRPINGVQYAREEVERLMDLADRIGDLIDIARRKTAYLNQIARLAEAGQLQHPDGYLPIPIEAVETALRNLFDYAFLADTPLGDMRLVQAQLPPGQVTHLDRGKTVHNLVLVALDKLRPGSAISKDPPPREWYPYLILRGAYLEETSNRELMQRLYISEGTFNRTRRAAIRSLARTLGEMEATVA
jgi:GAF domain-containing protein